MWRGIVILKQFSTSDVLTWIIAAGHPLWYNPVFEITADHHCGGETLISQIKCLIEVSKINFKATFLHSLDHRSSFLEHCWL